MGLEPLILHICKISAQSTGRSTQGSLYALAGQLKDRLRRYQIA
jgi:hypothetical protein